jgi:putative DNA primase/helicase
MLKQKRPHAGGLPLTLSPLMAADHWVIWRFEKTKDGKPTKVPYQARQPHRKASTKEPKTWASYEAAATAAQSIGVDGIGFCLQDTEFAAFDIDDCRDPATGVVAAWADALVKRASSYAEITVSNTGLRIIGTGTGPEVHRKIPVAAAAGVTCEIYRRATRYIVMTGNVYHDAPPSNIDSIIDDVVAELELPKQQNKGGTSTSEQSKAPRKLPQELRLMLDLQGETPAGYQSRSELFWSFVCTAVRKGVDENDVIAACLDEQYRGRSIYEHVQANRGESYVKRQLEKALNEDDSDAKRNGTKRIIRMTGKSYDEIISEMEQALLATQRPVFYRVGSLVEPIWRWEAKGHNSPESLSIKLMKLDAHRLTFMLTKHAAVFQKFHGNKWVMERWPHEKYVNGLLALSHWRFPTVGGVITTPTMRPDGSLITEPGYDKATKLYYKKASDIELSKIPEKPSKAQAAKALEHLAALISECSFKTPLDKAVALAAMMTVTLRGAFTRAPLFFISKPSMGTGGTYLVNIISTLASGRSATPLIVSPDPKELQKELTAAAYEGDPIINLNNLTFDLESSLLCQILDGKIKIRPFGKNTETYECDCAVTVFANGNNVTVVGDLVRRTLFSRLYTGLQNPQYRKFAKDPLAMIEADRGGYLADVFTIMRAFFAAGSPAQKGALSLDGYEQWARFVQQPLMWLGQPDPLVSQKELLSLDPQRNDVRERISALVQAFPVGKSFTAADIIKKSVEEISDKGLHNAFSGRDGRMLSVKSIGRLLMRILENPVDGHMIKLLIADEKTSNTYAVVAVEPVSPK